MILLLVLGSAILLAGIGGLIGNWLGERGGGDYNFAPLFTAPLGMAIGALLGASIGSLLAEVLL